MAEELIWPMASIIVFIFNISQAGYQLTNIYYLLMKDLMSNLGSFTEAPRYHYLKPVIPRVLVGNETIFNCITYSSITLQNKTGFAWHMIIYIFIIIAHKSTRETKNSTCKKEYLGDNTKKEYLGDITTGMKRTRSANLPLCFRTSDKSLNFFSLSLLMYQKAVTSALSTLRVC